MKSHLCDFMWRRTGIFLNFVLFPEVSESCDQEADEPQWTLVVREWADESIAGLPEDLGECGALTLTMKYL